MQTFLDRHTISYVERQVGRLKYQIFKYFDLTGRGNESMPFNCKEDALTNQPVKGHFFLCFFLLQSGGLFFCVPDRLGQQQIFFMG